jgi:methylmalonyl-CoA mutase
MKVISIKCTIPLTAAYYIESLTEQLAEKALELFKDIEANGGLITQLIEGTIQKKNQRKCSKRTRLIRFRQRSFVGNQ